MGSRRSAIAWALAVGLLASSGAQAAPIVSGGIVDAQGCGTATCGPSETLEMNPGILPLAPATGSIELDSVGLTLSLQMKVSSFSLTGVGGVPDNGISEVSFLNTIYSTIAVPLIDTGVDYRIETGQTANVSGVLSQDGAAGAFLATEVLLDGGCTETGPGIRCEISFGPMEFGAGVGTENPEPRYFFHVARIATVPEPSTLLLLGTALVIGIARGRRA